MATYQTQLEMVGNGNIGWISDDANAGVYTDIDDSGDDTDYLASQSPQDGQFKMASMPSDWTEITALTITFRYEMVGLSDDQFGLEAAIKDDYFIGANDLSDTVELVALRGNTTGIVQVDDVDITGLLSTTDKTTWDGAYLLITGLYDQNMGPDSGRDLRVMRAYLTMDYSAPSHTPRIGLGWHGQWPITRRPHHVGSVY